MNVVSGESTLNTDLIVDPLVILAAGMPMKFLPFTYLPVVTAIVRGTN